MAHFKVAIEWPLCVGRCSPPPMNFKLAHIEAPIHWRFMVGSKNSCRKSCSFGSILLPKQNQLREQNRAKRVTKAVVGPSAPAFMGGHQTFVCSQAHSSSNFCRTDKTFEAA